MQTHLPFAPPEASRVDVPEAAPRHTGVTPRRPSRVLEIFRGPFGLMIVETLVRVSYAHGRPTRKESHAGAYRAPLAVTHWTWDGLPRNDNALIVRGSYGPHPGIHPDAR